jgi:septum site-determining protein MinC
MPAFELKIHRMMVITLHLYTNLHKDIISELDSKIKQAPKLFIRTPILIDLTAVKNQKSDFFDILIKFLQKNDLIPIGIRGANPQLQALANEIGLNLLSKKEEYSSTKPLIFNEKISTKIISQPIRSGQQVITKGDLIILSSVSRGAEILAGHHIHVYGALRGRALAGVNGDQEARIFCQKMDAELISIAGQYQISDDFNDDILNKSVQIYLDNHNLIMQKF